MIKRLKRLVSLLPSSWQQELKRIRFRRQIRSGKFAGGEWEFDELSRWVASGDWVIDLGANIGHYTARLSEIVGPGGRVFAFEPIQETFELLAGNVSQLGLRNVTLFNVAASNRCRLVNFEVPPHPTGLANYYMAGMVDRPTGLQCLAVPVDSIAFPTRVALVKVDVEGHELEALEGMSGLLRRDRPVLIVEGRAPAVLAFASR